MCLLFFWRISNKMVEYSGGCMKTVILQNHSKNNEDFYQMSLMNHVKYVGKHEYDMIQINISYEKIMADPLKPVKNALRDYDYVFCLGSDVVFTNFEIKVESFLQEGQGVAISREDIGGSACNADTILFKKGKECDAVLKYLDDIKPAWEFHPWGIQHGFNILFAECPKELSGFINFQPVRVMQSTIFTAYPSCWKPNDFSLHFVGCHGREKDNRMGLFLRENKVWWRDGKL